MGNCLNTSRVQSAQSSQHPSGPSKGNSKSSFSSIPSTQTFSIPSTLTVPSYSGSSLEVLPTPRTEGEILSASNLNAFTFGDLKSATRNFRPDSLLGEGGFGYVYKGWIDEQSYAPSRPGSGMVVAIKKLKPEGFQGHKEWLTEVEYLGQLHHPNLVKLIGYCSDGDHRLLVYEYMPKGSLENHLFRRSSQPLSWAVRIKVAVGSARGFTFMHDGESQVIYRDVKASNILLDSEFNAKLSDFGLAKAGPTGDDTHVSTQVMGTHGYAAPEYVATGRLSAKADVYSFGVVLLELLSGRRALDKNKIGIEQNLVDWARNFIGDKRKLYRIMDPRLEGQYPKKGAYTVATLALQCISNEAKLRPRMSEVLATLEPLQDINPSRRGTPPANREAVEAMPTVRVVERASCYVCLEELEIGEEAREMPCKHRFHGGYILPWLEAHSTCPVCRHQLPVEGPKEDATVGDGGSGENGGNGRRFRTPVPWPFSGLFSSSGASQNNANGHGDGNGSSNSRSDES